MVLMLLAEQSAWAAFPGANGKIAFSSTQGGDEEIFVMDADGTDQIPLTDNDALDLLPAWSPDGSKTAFTSIRDGDWEIFVMNADGTVEDQLTFNTTQEAGPDWQPFGPAIAALEDLKAETNALPGSDLKDPAAGRKGALCDKIDAVIAQIGAGEYRGAITKLLQDIRPKLDSSSRQSWLTSPNPIILVKIDNVVAVLQSLL